MPCSHSKGSSSAPDCSAGRQASHGGGRVDSRLFLTSDLFLKKLDTNTTKVVHSQNKIIQKVKQVKKLSFGELELSILKIVRESERATVGDIYKSLGSKGSYTTIMTVMSRMADKGDLTREKEGKHYIYWIAPQNSFSSKTILQRIQDKIFGGKSIALVSYLLESDRNISDQELIELEQLIQKRRSEKNHG